MMNTQFIVYCLSNKAQKIAHELEPGAAAPAAN